MRRKEQAAVETFARLIAMRTANDLHGVACRCGAVGGERDHLGRRTTVSRFVHLPTRTDVIACLACQSRIWHAILLGLTGAELAQAINGSAFGVEPTAYLAGTSHDRRSARRSDDYVGIERRGTR